MKVGKDITLKKLKEQYKAVYVAVGLQNSAKLNIDGSDADGVFLGIPFLRDVKKGKKHKSGFDLTTGCELPPQSPPYNVWMMAKAVNDFGYYD